MRTMQWHYIETGELFEETQEDIAWESDPHCPICKQVTDYWEGTVDQDRMGNDIEAGHHVCYTCKLGTQWEYLD